MKSLYFKTLLKLAAILLFLAGIFACEEKEETEPDINVLFTEYSLEGTSYTWVILPYNDSVIVINSNEELEKYLVWKSGPISYPAIDFSKNSLLLVSGGANYGIVDLTGISQKISTKNCRLLLKCRQKLRPSSVYSWEIIGLIPKLPQNAQVSIGFDYKDEYLDMSHIDFNYIGDLYKQPLPVIEKAIWGKWKITSVCGGWSGCSYPDISVQFLTDKRIYYLENGDFSSRFYSWRKKYIVENGQKIPIYVLWYNGSDNMFGSVYSFRWLSYGRLECGVSSLSDDYMFQVINYSRLW